MISADSIKNKLKLSFIIIVCASFLMSCNSNTVYEKNNHIQNALWNKNEIIPFEFQIDDTLSSYNFYINIRNKTDYAYKNLYLFTKIIYPDNEVSKDTIDCLIADNEGKWFGEGWGKHRFLSLLLGKAIKFPCKGTYIIEFEQAMRMDTLKNISDIGIKIEKINPTK